MSCPYPAFLKLEEGWMLQSPWGRICRSDFRGNSKETYERVYGVYVRVCGRRERVCYENQGYRGSAFGVIK